MIYSVIKTLHMSIVNMSYIKDTPEDCGYSNIFRNIHGKEQTQKHELYGACIYFAIGPISGVF